MHIQVPTPGWLDAAMLLPNAGVILAPAANFINVNCSLTIGGKYLHA